MVFGEYFKLRRITLGKTLREFCIENNLDSVYISELERGVMPPPTGTFILNKLAGHLQLDKEQKAIFQKLAKES